MYWLKPVPGGTGDYSISGSFIGGDQNAGDAYTVSVNSLPAGTASINFQLYASIGGQDASPGNDTLVSGLLDILNAPSADGALLGQPNPVSLVNGLNGVNSSGGIVSGDVDGAGGMDLGGPLTTGTLPGTDGMWVRPYNPSAGVGGTAVNANGWTDILLGTFSYTFGNAGAVLGGQSARLWTAGVSYTGGGSANYADLWRQDGRSQRESDGNKVGAGPAVTIAVKPLVSVGGVSQLEGNQETTDFAFPITLSMPCAQPVQVTVDTIDGTATLADNDFQALHQVVTFAPGETSKTATVRVSGNARLENDETFTLSLSNVAGAGASLAVSTATGTVLNDDGTVPLGDGGGVVRIACDPGDPTHGTAAVFFNGSLVPTYVVATSRFSQFHVLGGAGQDRLTLDFAHGNPLPAQGLTFDEAVGKTGDSLAWQGMTGPLHASPSGITDGSMRPVTMHNVSFCEFAFADAPDNRLTIDGVTLALDRDNAISANAAVEVVNGGALDLGNKSHVVKSLALTDGRILNGTLESALHVLGNGEITAHVAGGRVVKIVPGTTVLSGQNSYTGGTEVLSDVLLVATSGALPGGGAITIGAGATVALGIDMNLTASAAATVAAVAPAVSPPSPRSKAEPGNQRNHVNPQVTPDSAISMLGDGLPTTPRLSAQPLVPVGDGPYRRSPLLAAASSRAVKPAAHAAALVAREAAPLPPAASWLVLTEQTVRPKRSSEKIGAALAAVDEVLARRGR
jgi:autotransporter-associated beta strand protein